MALYPFKPTQPVRLFIGKPSFQACCVYQSHVWRLASRLYGPEKPFVKSVMSGPPYHRNCMLQVRREFDPERMQDWLFVSCIFESRDSAVTILCHKIQLLGTGFGLPRYLHLPLAATSSLAPTGGRRAGWPSPAVLAKPVFAAPFIRPIFAGEDSCYGWSAI